MSRIIKFTLKTSHLSFLTSSFAVMGTVGDSKFVTDLICVKPGTQDVDMCDATEIQIALIDGPTNILLDTISLCDVCEITYCAHLETSFEINSPDCKQDCKSHCQSGCKTECKCERQCSPNRGCRGDGPRYKTDYKPYRMHSDPKDRHRHNHCRDEGCKSARCGKMRSKCKKCSSCH